MTKIHSLKEAISIKSVILTEGVNVSLINLKYKPIKPSLYSYEMTSDSKNLNIPQEVLLYKNDSLNIRVFSTIRSNINSEITLLNDNERIYLLYQGKKYQVDLPTYPTFYDHSIDGEISTKYFQKLGGDTIALVMMNYCEYYSRNVQCKFCEIHQNYKEQKDIMVMAKSPERMSEHLVNAILSDISIKQVIFNSGNYTKNNNKTYEQIIKTLRLTLANIPEERSKQIAFLVITAPPENLTLLRELKDAGATSIYINIEVWEEQQMKNIVPGKYQFGRGNYFKSFDESLKFFGKGYVYTNLIYGIQSIDLNQQVKKYDPDKEMDIISYALDELISRDVILTNTIYHSSGKNTIGKIKLDAQAVEKYHLHYGKRIHESRIVSSLCDSKNAVYASIEAIPNSLNNEPYVFYKFLEQNINV